ncbi:MULTISPECIES: chemotaxis protein CheB [unclassified Coleofasciculus]|uniref:chemotaxis protein CheB n=1 Tax=unclassified Coleofasciculus TaxID=2692782 RepID=UPI00187FF6B1|nr:MULTISPECIES: chemotaxis protein CheB [unclassified Coleofasciculus]MBE9126285.1 response regulator [Coleofasciculus sp. LEGE 07081]MBE9149204.1 response regulator [Coleofasciculus sp. LEGE 07092]
MTANRVVLVEDSPVALEILQRLLNSSPDVDVVGTARDGVEGLEVINRMRPDVICTDLLMENMDGLELTKRVMEKDPRPILVISNFVNKADVDNVFRLLQAGASDVFPKPTTDSPTDYEKLKAALITKIKVLSNMKVTAKRPGQSLSSSAKPMTSGAFSGNQMQMMNVSSRVKAIAIGASTGGLQAIEKIVCQLPPNFPLPIICTVHLSTGVLSGLINWLSSECPLQVKIAEVGESPLPGIVYFAPEKSNLELNTHGKFIYTNCPETDKHCPSISAMFKSIARFHGRATAGVLLTGIGSDGAEGLQAIAQAGGITVGQEEKGGAFGMVKEARALGAVQQTLSIDKIAPFLLKTLSE